MDKVSCGSFYYNYLQAGDAPGDSAAAKIPPPTTPVSPCIGGQNLSPAPVLECWHRVTPILKETAERPLSKSQTSPAPRRQSGIFSVREPFRVPLRVSRIAAFHFPLSTSSASPQSSRPWTCPWPSSQSATTSPETKSPTFAPIHVPVTSSTRAGQICPMKPRAKSSTKTEAPPDGNSLPEN